MANLFASATAATTPGGYTTNRLGVGQALAAPMPATQAFRLAGSQKPNVDNDHWAVHGTKLLAAAPLDVVDTIAAIMPGVERGDVNRSVYDAVGLSGFADFVEQNKGGVEVASGLLGAVTVGAAAEIAVSKLVGSAWFASTGIGAATQIGTRVAAAQRTAAQATQAAAAAGQSLRWYQGANLAYVGTKAAAYTGKAAVSELAIVAALHNNTAIWGDDMATNLLFAGLGLGVGGAIGAISARGAVNRWANSTEVMSEAAQVADPTGLERAYLTIPMGRKATAYTPKLSSDITSMYLNARTNSVAGGVTETSERAAIKSQTEEVAIQQLQKLTTKGTPNIEGSKFAVGRKGSYTPEGRQLTEALHEDPTTIYGAASLSAIDPAKGLTDTLKEMNLRIQAAISSKDAKRITTAVAQSKQVPLVLMDKTWYTSDEAIPHLDFNPDLIDARPTTKGIDELQWTSPHSGGKFILREDGRLNTNFDSLDIQDIHGVAEVANRQMTSMLRKKAIVSVPESPSFFEIDYALEYEKRGGVVDWTKANVKTTDEAMLKSLSLKYEATQKANLNVLDTNARFRLNLPRASSLERIADPDGAVLLNVMQAAKQGQSVSQIKQIRAQASQVFDFAQDMQTIDTLDGGLFGFNRSRESANGQWMRPVLGMFDDAPKNPWTKFDLTESIAENKAITMTILGSNKKAPLTSGLTGAITQMPEVRAAMEIAGLMDNQIGGTAGRVTASASQFVTQAHRFRNNKALSGAQTIRRVVNRVTELHTDEVLKRVKPYVDQIASTSGKQSRILLNQYYSNTAGWDIAKVQDLGDGMVGLVLDHKSAKNQQRLGRQVESGELLINPRTAKPIVLDQLANQTRMAMEKEFDALLRERNAIRAAMGLEPIRKAAFFTPPAKASANKFIGFTLDAANRPVPGKAIVAASKAEYESLAAALKKDLKPGERLLTQDQIKQNASLWDQAQMDFIDPTAMMAPSKQSMGTLASFAVNPNAFDEAVLYLKQGYEQVGNGVVRTIFDSQLKVAGIRGAAEANAKGVNAGAKNIWQVYEETLLGIPGTRNPTGLAGVFGELEKVADSAIASVWPSGAVSSLHMSDVLQKTLPSGTMIGSKDTKDFNSLMTALADYMPFKDAMDYANYTHGIKPPPELKDAARMLNRIGSGVILRWLEVPHAIMNMAGIITNMPGIVFARNVPSIGRVNGVPVIDAAKIMARGMKRMFREPRLSSKDWAMMVRNGDTSQDVAELHMQLSLLKGKSRFMKFVTGDPSGKTKMQRKGLEGMASIIADTSEDWSRQISHFIGLELADYHGITGLEARHNFARQIANDSIANYDPLNRPEIYQSAFGNMYGLFLSYAQNYYQRLFRWMEDEDYKAIGVSLATQASMFGFMGLPGAKQLSSLFESKEDSNGLLDGIYDRFGSATGAVVANGGFNQLVTLLGLPGMALHTRGDSNLRTPALDFLASATDGSFTIAAPIGLEVVGDIVTGLFEGAGAIMQGNPRLAAESFARNMPSRALRGTLSVLASEGQEVDAYGNVVSENQNAFEAAYRVLGLRSTRQQAEIESYFGNQKQMAMDAERRDQLRKSTKALIRSGSMDRLPEVFQKYVDTGGRPENYGSWIRNLIQESTNTRTENQLIKSLKGPAHQDLARRIELWTGTQ